MALAALITFSFCFHDTNLATKAAIHAFLCDNRDDVDDSTDLVIYGPCNNQQDRTVEGFA